MKEIKITDSYLRNNNLIYMQTALGDITSQINAKVDVKTSKNRCEYKVEIPDGYVDLFYLEAIDKMADIIAVNYKYCYFKKNIKISGLSTLNKELLLASLIAADIDEDKKYIIKKLKGYEEHSLDGIFNFRMKPLKEKWKEIAGYIPSGFTKNQLIDFILYLIKDKTNKMVYVESGCVYDKRFNKLSRVQLLTNDSGELPILKEILISGAGVVELCNKISPNEEEYIKNFYGDKVLFADSYV